MVDITRKLIRRLCGFLTIIGISAIYYLTGFVKAANLMAPRPEDVMSETTRPTILLWHLPFYLQKHYEKIGIVQSNMIGSCGGCLVTNDKNLLERSNAIVLHDNFVKRKENFPFKRYANQIYVFNTLESPYHTQAMAKFGNVLETYDEAFNMTISYRRDSDIQSVYGCWKKNGMLRIPDSRSLQGKKLAVILASECWRTGSKLRKIYSDALVAAGLPLVRLGKCFGKRYEGNVTDFLSNFKFYMAFENSVHCREYVTEKFWKNSLQLASIPVVWGTKKEDVERVAPPNSFIHVEDFKSAEQLAEYLLYLDRNDSAYLEYFQWRYLEPPKLDPNVQCGYSKTLENASLPLPRGICQLCRKISEGFTGRVNISQWWYGTESPECLSDNITELAKNRRISGH